MHTMVLVCDSAGGIFYIYLENNAEKKVNNKVKQIKTMRLFEQCIHAVMLSHATDTQC